MPSGPFHPVVLVHGAWHGAWCFTKLVDALTRLGVPVSVPDLPGHGSDSGELGDLAADAARVRDVLASIDGPAVVLGHSYGGLVISEAASDPATASGITHLVYLCAIVTAPRSSFLELPVDPAQSLLSPLIRMGDNGRSCIDTSDLAAAKAAFYGDCSDADVAYAAANLCDQPMGNMANPISGDPLATIAATYIRCTEDRAIPIEAQDAMIASASATAIAFTTMTLEASHSPFFSMPDALADQLAALARR